MALDLEAAVLAAVGAADSPPAVLVREEHVVYPGVAAAPAAGDDFDLVDARVSCEGELLAMSCGLAAELAPPAGVRVHVVGLDLEPRYPILEDGAIVGGASDYAGDVRVVVGRPFVEWAAAVAAPRPALPRPALASRAVSPLVGSAPLSAALEFGHPCVPRQAPPCAAQAFLALVLPAVFGTGGAPLVPVVAADARRCAIDEPVAALHNSLSPARRTG